MKTQMKTMIRGASLIALLCLTTQAACGGCGSRDTIGGIPDPPEGVPEFNNGDKYSRTGSEDPLGSAGVGEDGEQNFGPESNGEFTFEAGPAGAAVGLRARLDLDGESFESEPLEITLRDQSQLAPAAADERSTRALRQQELQGEPLLLKPRIEVSRAGVEPSFKEITVEHVGDRIEKQFKRMESALEPRTSWQGKGGVGAAAITRLSFDRDTDGIRNVGDLPTCAGGETTDCLDNCPYVANSDQLDEDEDGVGDACAEDYDRDGRATNGGAANCTGPADRECDDNCPDLPNPRQRDRDGDGIGDVCDTDLDGDGTEDATQPDLDHDRDGIPTGVEVGPDMSTPRDSDQDGIPDHRDMDDDDDGIATAQELHYAAIVHGTNAPEPWTIDTDGDLTPDYLDGDSDDDGLDDGIEGSATKDGPRNSDDDVRPDFLDPDDDNDGVSTYEEFFGGSSSGLSDANSMRDSDNDGIPDHIDAKENTCDNDNFSYKPVRDNIPSTFTIESLDVDVLCWVSFTGEVTKSKFMAAFSWNMYFSVLRQEPFGGALVFMAFHALQFGINLDITPVNATLTGAGINGAFYCAWDGSADGYVNKSFLDNLRPISVAYSNEIKIPTKAPGLNASVGKSYGVTLTHYEGTAEDLERGGLAPPTQNPSSIRGFGVSLGKSLALKAEALPIPFSIVVGVVTWDITTNFHMIAFNELLYSSACNPDAELTSLTPLATNQYHLEDSTFDEVREGMLALANQGDTGYRGALQRQIIESSRPFMTHVFSSEGAAPARHIPATTNAAWLRHAISNGPDLNAPWPDTSLPYIGHALDDIVRRHEGNENALLQAGSSLSQKMFESMPNPEGLRVAFGNIQEVAGLGHELAVERFADFVLRPHRFIAENSIELEAGVGQPTTLTYTTQELSDLTGLEPEKLLGTKICIEPLLDFLNEPTCFFMDQPEVSLQLTLNEPDRAVLLANADLTHAQGPFVDEMVELWSVRLAPRTVKTTPGMPAGLIISGPGSTISGAPTSLQASILDEYGAVVTDASGEVEFLDANDMVIATAPLEDGVAAVQLVPTPTTPSINNVEASGDGWTITGRGFSRDAMLEVGGEVISPEGVITIVDHQTMNITSAGANIDAGDEVRVINPGDFASDTAELP